VRICVCVCVCACVCVCIERERERDWRENRESQEQSLRVGYGRACSGVLQFAAVGCVEEQQDGGKPIDSPTAKRFPCGGNRATMADNEGIRVTCSPLYSLGMERDGFLDCSMTSVLIFALTIYLARCDRARGRL